MCAMLEQPIASYDSNTFTYICTQRRTASAATTTTTTPIVLILVILMLMSINSSAAMKKTAATVTTTNTSVFDSGVWLRIFHATRDMIFNYINSVERTATIVQQQYQPEIKTEFPCDTRLLVSRTVPTSVHRLRPGDFNVIAAIGDSLTVGSGATATSVRELFMENRGLSWCIGGQWTWRNATTLPNILRAINPHLVGYARGNALPTHADAQLNLAEIGATSADMPAMTREMVRRIRRDDRIDFRHDWKLVTTLIGGNDICSYVCQMPDSQRLVALHRANLVASLRYMRDHLPRTFVNIVSSPLVRMVIDRPNQTAVCDRIHLAECSCWLGRMYNQSAAKRKRYHQIQLDMQAVEADVAAMDEFQQLDTFAVVYQPFSRELSLKTDESNDDSSLLAYDCFHMSQKGHAWAGVSLWNNMLQPLGKKQLNWQPPQKRFLCPTDKFPYVFTNNNYNIRKESAIFNSI